MSDGDKVQHRVGGAAEGGVQHQSVAEASRRQELPGAPTLARQLDGPGARAPREDEPGREDGGHGAVAGQRQTQALREATHGIRSEQARAGAAGGTGVVFELGQFVRADSAAEVCPHRLEHVFVLDPPASVIARQHGPAGDDGGRQVEAGRGHYHAGHDFVTVGDEHQPVEGVSPGHDLHRIGDHLAAREGVVHPFVIHREPVAHADNVELGGYPPGLVHPVLDLLRYRTQVHVPRDKLVEGVRHADQRASFVATHPTSPGTGPRRLQRSARRGRSRPCRNLRRRVA